MEIQAAVLERPDHTLASYKLAIEPVTLDGPRDDEVLVRITSCGVCGTDRGCLHGLEPYPTPGVLGHEGAGVVEAVGRDVTLVAAGDRVVLGFPYCGVCRYCRGGQPRYCEKAQALLFSGYRLDGSTPLTRPDGSKLAGRFFQQSSWASYAVALQQQVAKVPEEIDADLMGPLGCSITTGAGTVMNELKPDPGSTIAIFGAGAVGLSAVMAAHLSGASRIIAIDTARHRLELARELGATDTILDGEGAVDEVKEITGGGATYAIEATNGANRVAEGVACLGKLGTCAMVGGASPSAEIHLEHNHTMLAGKRLIGIAGGSGQTPAFHLALMDLQAQGRFPLEKLVRYYPFAEIEQAIEDSDSGAVVKPILRMS